MKRLSAGERPAFSLQGDERDTAGVHNADLDVGMGLAVLGGHPAAFGPAVAMGAAFQADFAAFQVLALARFRANDDRLQHPVVLGRVENEGQAGLKFSAGEMLGHGFGQVESSQPRGSAGGLQGPSRC